MALPSRKSSATIENGVEDIRLKSEEKDFKEDILAVPSFKHDPSPSSGASGTNTPSFADLKTSLRSPSRMQTAAQSPSVKAERTQVVVGGDITVKQEPGKSLKLSRTHSHKIEKHAPMLFLDSDDATDKATSTFELLTDCTYANKSLGTTDPALECDCAEEWDANTRSNEACGEDSDCINRATKMECAADCGCGNHCQNQRFTRRLWADVTVIKTEKKGYGLRANTDLMPNDFIFEYIGEVIGENALRKRMQLYDEQGIKHFYFMSLNKGEFVDATKRGNLGRFCNHSCNPNCYVDKWVVGEKLRMGIFAERKIRAGEELVFNYNVDRYGADPQPCYCGEPNCTGYIGGKTQTERSTKLSKATIEALGIDDFDDWNTAVAKKPKKKKNVDEDEEYVNNLQPKELKEDGVRSVMAQLPQCKEKWIAVKLLNRLQRAQDSAVMNQVVRMHGYRHLKTALGNFMDDVNVCLQVLDVLNKLPRITRNKIQDSKIEDAIQGLTINDDERVANQSKDLLEIWSKLEIGYRIPRVKRDPNAVAIKRERRQDDRPRSPTRSKTPEKINAPSGPRNATAPRPRPPPRHRPAQGPLPAGWFEASAPNGSVYYYNSSGDTTWQRPFAPTGPVPPPPPPKAISDQKLIQDLIQNIVAAKKDPIKTETAVTTPTEQAADVRKEDRWKTYPEEKQKKIYEGLIQPHVMHVVNKFKHKMDKEDLKRLAKDMSKKIVASDFKNGQVKNLTSVNDKHAKKIKKHVHETFLKAMRKKAEHDKKHAAKQEKKESIVSAIDEPALSDDEDVEMETASVKRGPDEPLDEEASTKKARIEAEEVPQPPPPPPPPMDASPMDIDGPELVENGSTETHSPASAIASQSVLQTATPPTTGSPDMVGLESKSNDA